MSFRVLYVCTGNVCRSPAAELLMRDLSHSRADLEVTSAGLAALEREPFEVDCAAALRERGIDPDRHTARQFDPAVARRADLVLTAEVDQRDLVLREVPDGLARTFTMRDFARLEAHCPTDAAPVEVVAAAARGRSHARDSPAGSDIADPYRRGIVAARRAVDEIAETVEITLRMLDLGRDSRRLRPRPAAR